MKKIKMKNSFLKISVFSLLIIGCFAKTNAQGNLPYVDDKIIRFGFALGMNTMDFRVTESLIEIDGKAHNAKVSQLKPGFSVGVTTDLRLHDYWNLRFVPMLHFGERQITYRAVGETETSTTSIASIPITIPIYLKYSALRVGNFRPYLIGGGGALIDVGRDFEKPVLLNPIDYFVEFGMGFDIYFSFFKLSPELKFALGFNDMLIPLDDRNSGFISESDKKYSNALSKLTSRMLTLTFNFE